MTQKAFEPTEEQRRTVYDKAKHGVPHVDIADAIINPDTGEGITEPTLRKFFRKQLREGRVEANMAVAASMFDQAVGYIGPDSKFYPANHSSAKYWLAARGGPEWKEQKEEVTSSSTTQIVVIAKIEEETVDE